MVKGANEVWRDPGRKISKDFVEEQYQAVFGVCDFGKIVYDLLLFRVHTASDHTDGKRPNP